MPNTLKRTAASSRPRNFRHILDLNAGITLTVSGAKSCFRFADSETPIGAFTYAEKAIHSEFIMPQKLRLTRGASS
jgi:hypothetical protein